MIISTEELKRMIENGGVSREVGQRDFILIDVRREEELVNGMIPTAKHICLDDFEHAFDLEQEEFKDKYGFDKPSKDYLIIVHCRTGGRSAIAAEHLRRKGYNVKNYEGSVRAWSEIDDKVRMY